jgi:predicted RNA-binding Zn-ribbon protein involved in translation (DUF1610 family)|tara:strand:- start:251 stop:652 length:402 start_codon:yes stop_codon:yes gene_type:complete
MKSFCPHCGAQMIYSGPKPKFCSSCGENLNSFSSVSNHKKKGQPEREEDEQGNPNLPEPPQDYVPNIDSLDIEIQPEISRSCTLGQVLETYSEVQPQNQNLDNSFSTPPSSKVSREQFREQFKKEAGTLRPRK